MDPKLLARGLAVGRIGFGVAALAAPRSLVARWTGTRKGVAGAQVLARTLGVRDLVIAGIALHTLDAPGIGPRWIATAALCDAVDAAAILAARRDLPSDAATAGLASAVGGALTGFAVAAALRAAQGEPPQPQPA